MGTPHLLNTWKLWVSAASGEVDFFSVLLRPTLLSIHTVQLELSGVPHYTQHVRTGALQARVPLSHSGVIPLRQYPLLNAPLLTVCVPDCGS
jgi:hypothetical protein